MNRALCLLLPISSLGCFDVERVDPGSEVERFLVDDFESTDQLPEPPFQQWACRAFQPDDDPTAVEDCAFVPSNGGTAFMGLFALRDEPNGIPEFEGASLSASTTRPLDLRRYRDLTVSVRFEPSDVVIENAPNNLYIELTCRTARVVGTTGNPANEVPHVSRKVPVTPRSWFTFRIDLQRFAQPAWQFDRIVGELQSCLARVDSLAFVLSTDVADGETGGAALYIDDVSFQ